jgi:hypothetical protein
VGTARAPHLDRPAPTRRGCLQEKLAGEGWARKRDAHPASRPPRQGRPRRRPHPESVAPQQTTSTWWVWRRAWRWPTAQRLESPRERPCRVHFPAARPSTQTRGRHRPTSAASPVAGTASSCWPSPSPTRHRAPSVENRAGKTWAEADGGVQERVRLGAGVFLRHHSWLSLTFRAKPRATSTPTCHGIPPYDDPYTKLGKGVAEAGAVGPGGEPSPVRPSDNLEVAGLSSAVGGSLPGVAPRSAASGRSGAASAAEAGAFAVVPCWPSMGTGLSTATGEALCIQSS